MRKNSKKLVLPAIAAAGAVMGAVHMASADFVVTLSAPTTTQGYDIYTMSVINNTLNGSGNSISGDDVTITMNTPGVYIRADQAQDLGTGSTYGDGIADVNLTGNQNAGGGNGVPGNSGTVTTDGFGSVNGTFTHTTGATLTADFENGVKDTTQSWSSDANGGTVASVYSSLTSLEIVTADVSAAQKDSVATKFVNIVVPHGATFTVTGEVGTALTGGNKFQTNFTTSNSAPVSSSPIVLLSATAPTNTGSQVTGTYSPSTAPTLTVTNHGAPGEYIPGYAHALTGSPSAGYTAVAGFTGGDTEIFLLKLSSSTGDSTIISDINAGSNGTLTASAPTGALATLGGTTWDIELTEKAGAPANGFFGFNFAGETNVPGVTVTDIAAVPEPATAGLLMVGGLGLLARRRRSSN